ncbi:hypothetical protein O988_09178, partial [Pseudogymnoascus sp. VKM F-3808]
MSSNPPNTSNLTSFKNMSISFLTLPRELRDKIYEFCLSHDEPICPWDGYYDKELSSGLILTNKTINREASMVLYRNCFDFTKITPKGVTSFLEQIGRNVDYIQHVYIHFPTFRDLKMGSVAIGDNDGYVLASIQSNCVNLKTLTTFQSNIKPTKVSLIALNPKFAPEALALVDASFRAIASLQDIIVEVDDDCLSDYMRELIESHGWTIVDAHEGSTLITGSRSNWSRGLQG